jgi:hypothetical protein
MTSLVQALTGFDAQTVLDILTKCYVMDTTRQLFRDAHAACMRPMHACLALDC